MITYVILQMKYYIEGFILHNTLQVHDCALYLLLKFLYIFSVMLLKVSDGLHKRII